MLKNYPVLLRGLLAVASVEMIIGRGSVAHLASVSIVMSRGVHCLHKVLLLVAVVHVSELVRAQLIHGVVSGVSRVFRDHLVLCWCPLTSSWL